MRIACLVTNRYEDSELDEPVAALRREGHTIDIISQSSEEIQGKQGRSRVSPDYVIDEVRASDFDALFIPGGHSPDSLRMDERFLEFVRAFDAVDKPIWAICHGPQLLLTAGILEGRTLTAWPSVQDDLRRAGIDVRDHEVVVDSNLVTSRRPEDLPAFCRTITEMAEEVGVRRPGVSREAPGQHVF